MVFYLSGFYVDTMIIYLFLITLIGGLGRTYA